MPLVSVLGRQRQIYLQVQSRPGLQSEIQSCTEKPFLEKQNRNRNKKKRFSFGVRLGNGIPYVVILKSRSQSLSFWSSTHWQYGEMPGWRTGTGKIGKLRLQVVKACWMPTRIVKPQESEAGYGNHSKAGCEAQVHGYPVYSSSP